MNAHTAARALFILLHGMPAAVCITLYGATPVWLPTSILLGLVMLATLDATATRIGRSVVSLQSGALATVSLLLGVSFYFQGEAFNARFFFHFDVTSLLIALSEYRWHLVVALAIIMLGLLLPAVLKRTANRKLAPSALSIAWLVGLATHYPIYAFFEYLTIEAEFTATPPAPPATVAAPPAADQTVSNLKNIILIYAESLERTYFDRALFGTLLPGISTLRYSAIAIGVQHLIQYVCCKRHLH